MGFAVVVVLIMPPSDAIGPTWVRTSFWISERSWASSSVLEEELRTKAKGSCPFKLSGIPTTHASVNWGWEVIACSSVPGRVLGQFGSNSNCRDENGEDRKQGSGRWKELEGDFVKRKKDFCHPPPGVGKKNGGQRPEAYLCLSDEQPR